MDTHRWMSTPTCRHCSSSGRVETDLQAHSSSSNNLEVMAGAGDCPYSDDMIYHGNARVNLRTWERTDAVIWGVLVHLQMIDCSHKLIHMCK